jgi:hypothetical protein
MQRGLSVDIDREGTVSETVRLFVLPPLLTFALIALSLVLFTIHLAQKDLQTTFVLESRRQAGGNIVSRELVPAAPALAALSPR